MLAHALLCYNRSAREKLNINKNRFSKHILGNCYTETQKTTEKS